MKQTQQPSTNETDFDCPRCRGLGYFILDVPLHHEQFGKAIPCNDCIDLSRNNGLLADEQSYTIGKIRDIANDPNGYGMALRVIAGAVVQQSRGFITVFGGTGVAKSILGKVIVAECTRRGAKSLYTTGKKMEKSLFMKMDSGNSERSVHYGIIKEQIQRTKVLVVDELQTANWKNEWVAGELQELLDERYRRAHVDDPSIRQVTVLISQYDPLANGSIYPEFLQSRMRDGAHAIPWPEELIVQKCVGEHYGKPAILMPFGIQSKDMRPGTPAAMSAPTFHPQTGEFIG